MDVAGIVLLCTGAVVGARGLGWFLASRYGAPLQAAERADSSHALDPGHAVLRRWGAPVLIFGAILVVLGASLMLAG